VDIGIGLPNAVPGTYGRILIDWARNAEEAGFSTLGTIGRLVYQGYEELVALSAAAAVTSSIRLTTSVLLAPLYSNTALLAKQAASIDRLSGGRLVLGLGLGGRADDYHASGLPAEGRGRRLDEQLTEMKRIWSGEKRGYAGGIGPEPGRRGGPELILGGSAGAAFRRVALFGDGWIMGGGTPGMFAEAAAGVDQAWREAARPGRPRKLALAYFALGSSARAQADNYLLHYYDWLGDAAAQIAAGAAVSAEMARDYAAAFEAGGCDEVIFIPTTSSPDQVRLLAGAVLLGFRSGRFMPGLKPFARQIRRTATGGRNAEAEGRSRPRSDPPLLF
jgi:alkanesulfonate monooxygenase SsuD/methylene tetrahydromethanopterin reductase-like flavin-dependent oxidoreductase (luciferase family)